MRSWAIRMTMTGAAAMTAPPLAAQPATAPVETATLCGVPAGTIATMRAMVAADPRFKRQDADRMRETYASEALQAIWSFTTGKNPVHPAALCEQVVERGGTMQIERRPLCEAGAAACAAFAAEMRAREDGSGDGE